MIGQSAAVLAIPWLAGDLLQAFTAGATFSIGWISLALVGLFAAQAILSILRSFVLAQVSQDFVATLRNTVYQHVQDLPIGFHLQRQRGDVMSLLLYETERLANFITGPLLSFLPQLLTLIGALILMMRLDLIMSIPIALGVPTAIIVSKLLGRKFRSVAKDWQNAYRKLIGQVESNLSMLPMIKSFVRERKTLERYALQVDELRRLGIQMARRQAVVSPVMQFAAAAAVIFFLWISASRLQAGEVQTNEFVSFLLYAALLTRPMASLSNLWGQTQLAKGALERLQQSLSLPTEPFGIGKVPETIKGRIVFEKVSFSHDGRKPSLKGVNLEILTGETVALTGENGAGKSTLIELLMRLHTPDSGHILVDGLDIQGLDLRALRAAIGLVPQRAYLFDGTARENILFGNPAATQDDMERAADAAQAARFIGDLSEGYDTIIGDKGVKLSGGERQRIALARALIKDPPILILDEPTAMFDMAGEVAFVKSVHETFAKRTVILITHRPESLKLVDRVVVLENGSISQDYHPISNEHENHSESRANPRGQRA